jgi:hypothetical protein
MRIQRALAAAALATVLLLPGCELLTNYIESADAVSVSMPRVTMPETNARLVKYPGVQQMASWACDQTLGSMACGLIPYYRTPVYAQLQFQFALTFRIENPNRVPVPTTELLVALDLWPDRNLPNAHLAGICTTLCEPGTVDCPIPAGGACVDQYDDVDDLSSLLAAALKAALLLTMEAVNGQPVGGMWEAWTIPPSDTVDLTFTFSIGIEEMLNLILQMVQSDVLLDVLKDGAGNIDIPYAIAGKLWFQVPYLGRVAIGLGPYGTAADPLIWRIDW